MREIKFRAWDDDGEKIVMHYSQENKNEIVSLMVHDTRLELMQYIGLKDKNSVDIYEGDIVRANIISWSLATMGEIVFDSEHSSYCNKNESGLTQLQRLNKFEVIGNVYENPELLETK